MEIFTSEHAFLWNIISSWPEQWSVWTIVSSANPHGGDWVNIVSEMATAVIPGAISWGESKRRLCTQASVSCKIDADVTCLDVDGEKRTNRESTRSIDELDAQLSETVPWAQKKETWHYFPSETTLCIASSKERWSWNDGTNNL